MEHTKQEVARRGISRKESDIGMLGTFRRGEDGMSGPFIKEMRHPSHGAAVLGVRTRKQEVVQNLRSELRRIQERKPTSSRRRAGVNRDPPWRNEDIQSVESVACTGIYGYPERNVFCI